MANAPVCIEVQQGTEQVPAEDWDKLRVIGLGLPAWEVMKDKHGIDPTDKPAVAVVTKLTADGISGSSFIAAGVAAVDIPLRRICPEASGRARLQMTIDVMDLEFPKDTDVRNISLWKDVKPLPNTRVAHTRSREQNDAANQRDQQLYEGLSGLLVRAVIMLGMDLTVYISLQLIPQSLPALRDSLVGAEGTPVMDPQCPSIPAISIIGKDTGMASNGKGLLVPAVSEVLAKNSGLGICPLLFSEGGLSLPAPALSVMKNELFSFLRRAVRPKNIPDANAWMVEFQKDQWEYPPVPTLRWPAPDPVQNRVAEGEWKNIVLGGKDGNNTLG